MSSNTSSKTTLEDQFRRLIAFLPTLGVQSLTLLGQTYLVTDLVQRFTARINAAEAVATAKRDFHDAVTKERELAPLVRALRLGIKSYLVASFGKQSQKLVEAGFTRAPTVTVESKVQAVASRKATRALRHTMGTRQRRAVKGKGTTPAPGNGGGQPVKNG
jgi:hypothetical protein